MSSVLVLFAAICCWIQLRHDLEQPSVFGAALGLSIVMIVGMLSRAHREVNFKIQPSIAALFAFAFATGAYFLGGLTEPLFLCLAFPFLLQFLGKGDFIRRCQDGAIFGFCFLSMIGLLQPTLKWIAARHWASDQMAAVMELFLTPSFEFASHINEKLLVSNGSRNYEYLMNWETLALEPIFLLALGACTLGALRRLRWTFFAVTIATTVVFIIFRLVVVINVAIYLESPRVFYNSLVLILSLVPLGMMVDVFYRRHLDLDAPTELSISISKRTRLSTSLCIGALVGIFIAFTYGFQDPGVKKTTRIIFDESNSDWSWTDVPLNREEFGVTSVYNFTSLYEYLTFFYDVERNEDEVTKETLDNTDVLVVKMPTSAYSEREIQVIESFVADGGGLFVIGDHTNVFGTSTYSNQLLSQFGLKLNYDGTHEVNFCNETYYDKPDICPHPIVLHLSGLEFQSSCSLNPGWHGETIIDGYAIKEVDLDYSSENFFTPEDQMVSHPHRFGRSCQAAVTRHGKGRVSIFTDSTMFSSFCIFWKGRPELALGYMEWTGRGNRYPWVPLASKCTLVITVLLALYLLIKNFDLGSLAIKVLAGTIGWAVVSISLAKFTEQSYLLPISKREMPLMSIAVSHSETFNDAMLYNTPSSEDLVSDFGFSSFVVASQRSGLIPVLSEEFVETINTVRLAVVMNLSTPIVEDDAKKVKEFLNSGGTLLFMADIRNYHQQTTVSFLEDYGITVTPRVPKLEERDKVAEKISNRKWKKRSHFATVVDKNENERGIIDEFLEIEGGELVIFSAKPLEPITTPLIVATFH